MQNKQKILSTVILTACSGISTQALATLPDNAILKFEAGVVTTSAHGTEFVKSGSYFGMDTNGNGAVTANERTALVENVGITLGNTQAATGSHSGAPDGSESPGIDQPWGFFGNTGLHYTSNPTIVLTTSGNTATIDFSGWGVTWNGIAEIPMGAGAWGPNAESIAEVTCLIDCDIGDTYTLTYTATVPAGDPSGFGGVAYDLLFTGTVATVPPPTADDGIYAPGDAAASVGSTSGRLSMDQFLTLNPDATDDEYSYAGGLVDFKVTGLTNLDVSVEITLLAPIPADSVYRKYINGTWETFLSDGTNIVTSAAPDAITGLCPGLSNGAYDHPNGLVEGDRCVQLTIADNGAYDSDPSATNIADPGGVATPIPVQVDTRTWGTDGCSMTGNNSSIKDHAEWWLVAAFIGVLGWFNFRREDRSHQA